MSAGTARRGKQKVVGANGHRQPNGPSREHLQRENERLLRENEELRRKVAEGEKQIADAEKQIADLERQLAGRKKNSTNSSKPPSLDELASEQRARGRKRKSKRKPARAARTRGASSTVGSHRRGERGGGAVTKTMWALRRKAAAKVRQGQYARRLPAASGNRGATGKSAHHRVPVSERDSFSHRR